MGSSFTGDIAIDDVLITTGSCFSPSVLPTNQSIGGKLILKYLVLILFKAKMKNRSIFGIRGRALVEWSVLRSTIRQSRVLVPLLLQ